MIIYIVQREIFVGVPGPQASTRGVAEIVVIVASF
jgi:hypothetical protein